MSNPQQPGQFGPPHDGNQGPSTPPGGQPPQTPPGGSPQQPYGQGPGTPPGGQPYGQQQPPPFGQQPQQPGQPGPGQPYGQPGQQPPFQGGPGQPGFQGAPPAKPGGKGKIVKLVVGIVVLIAVGIAAVVYFTKSPATANAGDCIKVNDASATDADVEKIDCGSADAIYKVGKKLDSGNATCPGANYDSYYTKSKSGGGFTLCLMLNAKDGECFDNVISGGGGKATRVTCGPGAEIQVVKVINGKADETACDGEAEGGVVYEEPPTTLCLKRVEA